MAVTIDDVKVIVPPLNGKPTDAQYTMALDTANLIRTEQLTNVSGCMMSADRLDKITMYLAAHFLEGMANAGEGIPAVGLKRSKLGEADESYAVPAEALGGYSTTRWGQLALALDTCGILAASTAGNGLKAQFRVVSPTQSGARNLLRVTPDA